MDLAQNILVIKTVSGMANAVCAAVDALSVKEIVGSIAGDDTILCVARTTEDAAAAMKYLRKLVDK
jgi:transcriptional regulator of arginine metabolism